MEINIIKSGPLKTNIYIIINGNHAIIIDPEGGADRISDFLSDKNAVPEAVLLTHGHFDHIGAAEELRAKYSIPVYMNTDDVYLTGQKFGKKSGRIINPDFSVEDGGIINAAGLSVKVLCTPGHTEGSVCYITGGYIFSGDTLFYNDCGRTDLDGGSEAKLTRSLQKLFGLSGGYIVYPGHGKATTLDDERRYFGYV